MLKGEKIRKTPFISVQELGSQCEVKNVRTATTVLDSKIFLHFKIEDVFSLSQTRQYIKKEVDNFFYFYFWVKLFESTLFKLDPP